MSGDGANRHKGPVFTIPLQFITPFPLDETSITCGLIPFSMTCERLASSLALLRSLRASLVELYVKRILLVGIDGLVGGVDIAEEARARFADDVEPAGIVV